MNQLMGEQLRREIPLAVQTDHDDGLAGAVEVGGAVGAKGFALRVFPSGAGVAQDEPYLRAERLCLCRHPVGIGAILLREAAQVCDAVHRDARRVRGPLRGQRQSPNAFGVSGCLTI